MRVTVLVIASAGVAVACIVAALLSGSVPLTAGEVFTALFSADRSTAYDIVWALRMPRALAAFACGGLLALAGALLQALLRNALADSYLLGVASGASLGALSALALSAGAVAMNALAFIGALGAILIVFGVTYRRGGWNIYRLLLSGVVLSAGLSALTSLILVTAPQVQVKGMLFWLMGDLSQAENPWVALVLLAVFTVMGIAYAIRLDVLGLGELKARALGVSVAPLQGAVLVVAALATMAAVLLGGAIGFIGLITPHAVRLCGITHHRLLLPLAVLWGGSFLVLADICARSLLAPQQLPVGIFTALIGVPCMLVLLARRT